MSDVNLSISQEVVKPIIEAKIQAAIVEQLLDSGTLIQAVVARVMETKVDTEGNPARYGESTPYVKWLCEKCIKDAARAAVVEAVEKMKPALQKAIVADLQRRKETIALSLVDYFIAASKSSYNIHANVTLAAKT